MNTDDEKMSPELQTSDSELSAEERRDDLEILNCEEFEKQEIPPSQRQSSSYMTKYEKARILGTRALQISRNAPILVEPGNDTDPLVIAEKELREKKIPFIIRRYLPDGSYEDWPVDQLILE